MAAPAEFHERDAGLHEFALPAADGRHERVVRRAQRQLHLHRFEEHDRGAAADARARPARRCATTVAGIGARKRRVPVGRGAPSRASPSPSATSTIVTSPSTNTQRVSPSSTTHAHVRRPGRVAGARARGRGTGCRPSSGSSPLAARTVAAWPSDLHRERPRRPRARSACARPRQFLHPARSRPGVCGARAAGTGAGALAEASARAPPTTRGSRDRERDVPVRWREQARQLAIDEPRVHLARRETPGGRAAGRRNGMLVRMPSTGNCRSAAARGRWPRRASARARSASPASGRSAR